MCDIELYLKFCLKKYTEGRSLDKRKFCHFYTNGQKWPFEQMVAISAMKSLYGRKSSTYMCQYCHFLFEIPSNDIKVTEVNNSNIDHLDIEKDKYVFNPNKKLKKLFRMF